MTNSDTGIRVLKSRNISNDGSCILDIPGYDSYIYEERAERLCVFKFLNRSDVYLTPNMTYYPRVIKKPDGVLVNGSAAILMLKSNQKPLSQEELDYYASDEYRAFYRTARNQQTRSLNVDANSVYFFGRLGDQL
jgi:DNA (cytosine-5)-methyltransferase 1